jgi:DNA-binding winged helix-turn-helix (wHTH) protein
MSSQAKKRDFPPEDVLLPPRHLTCLNCRLGTTKPRLPSELFSTLWPDIHVFEANLTKLVTALRKVIGSDAIQTDFSKIIA